MGGLRVSVMLLCVLFVLPMVIAPSASIFKDWVYPGDPFSLRGHNYTTENVGDEYGLVLKIDGVEHIMSYDSCFLSEDGRFQYCFTNSDWVACAYHDYDCPTEEDLPDDWCCPYDVAHLKFIAGKPVFGSYLEFSELTPELAITQTAGNLSDTSKLVPVTITLTNKGEETLTDVSCLFTVPDTFTVFSAAPELVQKNQTLTTKMIVPVSQPKILSYTVKPKGYVSGTFKANCSYVFREQQYKVTAATFTIGLTAPGVITQGFAKKNLSLGQSTTYKYAIKNNEADEMKVALILTGLDRIDDLPEYVRQNDEGVVYWDVFIAPGAAQNITLPYVAHGGTNKVIGKLTFTVGGKTYENTTEESFIVPVTPVTPAIDAPPAIVGGQPLHLLFSVENKGETNYSELASTVAIPGSLGGGGRLFAIQRLAPGERKVIGDLTLPTAVVEKETSIRFTWNGTYRAVNDEYRFSQNITIAVLPAKTGPFELSRQITGDLLPGATLTVLVNVKNLQPKSVTAQVHDTFPSSFSAEGASNVTLNLSVGEELLAYRYTVKVPADFTGQLSIVTLAEDLVSGEKSVKESTLLVAPTPTAPAAPVENTTQTASTADVEKGFFGKIIDFFKGLF